MAASSYRVIIVQGDHRAGCTSHGVREIRLKGHYGRVHLERAAGNRMCVQSNAHGMIRNGTTIERVFQAPAAVLPWSPFPCALCQAHLAQITHGVFYTGALTLRTLIWTAANLSPISRASLHSVCSFELTLLD